MAGLEATAAGMTGNVLATGALEIAAGMWARTLAAARVEGTDALTPRIRHRIGRDLIREGESVHLIDTGRGHLRLAPVSSFDVGKGWRYAVEVAEPPGMVRKRTVARDGVLHVVWSEDPLQPWRGIGPLPSILAKLAVDTETKLLEDLATPTAAMLPIPSDGGDGSLDSLRSDIGSARGGAVLAEATSTGWDDGRQQAGTRSDWKAQRLGPEIPEQLREAFQDVQDAVGAACGIPAA